MVRVSTVASSAELGKAHASMVKGEVRSNAVDAGKRRISEFYDPYCFVDLFDRQGGTADLAAPDDGAGMDGS